MAQTTVCIQFVSLLLVCLDLLASGQYVHVDVASYRYTGFLNVWHEGKFHSVSEVNKILLQLWNIFPIYFFFCLAFCHPVSCHICRPEEHLCQFLLPSNSLRCVLSQWDHFFLLSCWWRPRARSSKTSWASLEKARCNVMCQGPCFLRNVPLVHTISIK